MLASLSAFFHKRPALGWLLISAAVCGGFAAFTQHRWEDYYITLRASRNLVEGHGLVFQTGERVHTFTSPVGVLLPALSLKLAGVQNDTVAIWVFRAFCISAFAAAVFLLRQTAQALRWPSFACVLLPVLLLTDAKSVDFTINGMETAFMLFLLAAAVNILATGGSSLWWRLGLCWGGLMWTRPDGFIFGGALAVAWLIVLPAPDAGPDRRGLVRAYLRAVAVAAVVYAPWFLWAWNYYGSPVPHTIIAKGLASHTPAISEWPVLVVRQLLLFPWWGGLRDTFLPAYVWHGGWPVWVKAYYVGAAWAALLYFLWPAASRPGRAFSLTFFLCSLYGTAAPAAPWYVPSHALFAMLTLATMAADFSQRWPRLAALRAAVAGHALAGAVLLVAVAWQLRAQQAIIETQRREIGRWLHDQSASNRESVWLEPLGYIGYFSQLKMLDFPGLCAPEVVAARRTLGNSWPKLIRRLRPSWLVLRPVEASAMSRTDPALLSDEYEQVRIFDATPAVAACGFLPGRSYLELDQTFQVFRRKTELQ